MTSGDKTSFALSDDADRVIVVAVDHAGNASSPAEYRAGP